MATLFDSASLALIPSGVKESKVYSIKPTDGSGDFTFSRGTDTATRVNASGLIEKERGNLVLQSNTFTNASWTKSGGAVTGGQSGYDGSSDAYSFISDTSNGGHRVIQTIASSGVNTISIYAKANGYNYLAIYEPNNGGKFFDLANGLVGNTMAGSAPTFASIESVGGGWYRCSIVCDTAVTSVEYWMSADGTNHIFTGNGTSGVFIQDAMLNQGLVAQPYIETTTAAVYEGITDNLPRLDYSGGASCPSLLLEPSRTNLLVHSEYFGASYWTKSGVSVVGGFTSPEGLSNAYKLVEDSSNGQHFIYSSNSGGSVGNKITTSFFVKADTRSWCRIIGYDGSSVWFDLENGVLGTQTNAIGSIEPLLNDWYKISSTYTSSNASAEKGYLYLATGNNSTTYQGDGTSGIYIYGAQLELGSYPTSYIPTYGTSASRAADDAKIENISDIIGQTEGTLFVDATIKAGVEGVSRVSLSAGNSTNNWIFLGLAEGIVSQSRVYINYLGVTYVNAYGSALSSGRHKYALAYKENDVVLYVDGVLQVSDTSVSIPLCDKITLTGSAPNTDADKIEERHQTLLFKTRLTNAELAALTTI